MRRTVRRAVRAAVRTTCSPTASPTVSALRCSIRFRRPPHHVMRMKSASHGRTRLRKISRQTTQVLSHTVVISAHRRKQSTNQVKSLPAGHSTHNNICVCSIQKKEPDYRVLFLGRLRNTADSPPGAGGTTKWWGGLEKTNNLGNKRPPRRSATPPQEGNFTAHSGGCFFAHIPQRL